MPDSVSIVEAFAAGVAAIRLPCALVLTPALLAFLAGSSLTGTPRQAGQLLLGNSLTFAVGFLVAFAALGSSLGGLSRALYDGREWVAWVGGIVLFAVGLAAVGLLRFRLRLGSRDWRAPGGWRLGAAALVGFAVAAAWTPCVDRTLSQVLTLAADPATGGAGAGLLSVWTLGLMTPLLALGALAGITLHRFAPGRWPAYGGALGGVLTIVLGVLVFTDRFTQYTGYLRFLSF
ncbi:MAG: hypothetical protein EXR60_06185 [Dehalococcoidia bacterium]|nr:hypothetical protein [Dehalococcoidia bacterium]